jgi:phage terminase large subunit GpA-like protein
MWADQYRMLSAEASAEPGPWRTSRVPYAKKWMDSISDPRVHTVVVKSASQNAKSEVVNNAVGYFIHYDACPILLIQPTLDRMRDYSKKRIQPLLRDTPVLAALVSDDSRDGDNTIFSKSFVGGHLLMTGANAASGLASNPIRVVLADEIDRFPRDVQNEGDPLSLALRRQTTFTNRKTVVTSTPTIEGASRIDEEYKKGTQEQYFVPCPECGHMQTLRFRDDENYRLQWETDEEGKITECYYVCEKGCVIQEHHKLWMISEESGAEWVAQRPFDGTVSFEINTLYSPWYRWTEIARDFIVASQAAKEGNPTLLKVFVNTILGQCWNTDQEGAEITGLEAREETYEADIPLGGLVLTAGVDVQPDRLECEVVAWGQGEESWSINYYVIPGDTNTPHPWQQLLQVLTQEYECEREDDTGTRLKMNIRAVCIDTGGHNTQAAYAFTRAHTGRKFLAIKGSSTGAKEAISLRPSKIKGGVLLYMVGTNLIKDKLFGMFKVNEPGPGYCHFPLGYDTEYYKQLGAEKRVKKIKKFDKDDPHGYSLWQYKKIRSRNEALDCRVYAMAALAHLNVNLPRELEKQNLQCLTKSSTLYVGNENSTLGTQKGFVGRFGTPGGFVSSWGKR